MRFETWVLASTTLHVADWLLTSLALAGGLAAEGNPFGAWLWATGGPTGLMAAKLVAGWTLVGSVWLLYKAWPRAARVSAWATTALLSLVVANNLVVVS